MSEHHPRREHELTEHTDHGGGGDRHLPGDIARRPGAADHRAVERVVTTPYDGCAGAVPLPTRSF
ncbi:hypothetical protein ACIQ7D_19160 [Streptomyces sp. NPDC096310]|uniref:hypothetical protein n=1 Tax=Streptomyces sp. NPDC096310 TaxID=3366082 RepID=UPI0038298059